MITQRYFERDGEKILFRFAVNDAAVFDVLTTGVELERCRAFLRQELNDDVEEVRMGGFGPFDVFLNRDTNVVSVQIFIYAPKVSDAFSGEQCVGAFLRRDDLLAALDESRPFARRSSEGR